MTDTDLTFKLLQEICSQASAVANVTGLQPFDLGTIGKFPPNWQDSMNTNFWNRATYDWISSTMTNTNPISSKGDNFTNNFELALIKIDYLYSAKDQATINGVSLQAAQQGMSLHTAWSNAGLPYDTTAGSNVVDQIFSFIQKNWSSKGVISFVDILNSPNVTSLLNKAPPSAAMVFGPLICYLSTYRQTISLFAQQSAEKYSLDQLITAILNPPVGRCIQFRNDDKHYPSYKINDSPSDIANSLQNTGSTIQVKYSVEVADNPSQCTISMAEGASCTGSAYDLFTISAGGNDCFKEVIAKTNSKIDITMTFPGVTAVNFAPGTDWCQTNKISQAVRNVGKDATGFHFIPKSNKVPEGISSLIYGTQVVISQDPTITMVIHSDSCSAVYEQLKQTPSVDVTVFGKTLLGCATEPTCKTSTSMDETSQTVTFTITPPLQKFTVSVADQRAYVLGIKTLNASV